MQRLPLIAGGVYALLIMLALGQTPREPVRPDAARAVVRSVFIEEWFGQDFIVLRLDSGVEHTVKASSVDALVHLPAAQSYALACNGYSVTLRGPVDKLLRQAMAVHALDQLPRKVFDNDRAADQPAADVSPAGNR